MPAGGDLPPIRSRRRPTSSRALSAAREAGRARRPASTSTSSPSSPRCRCAIGASATGARTYTATASQGLLYMAEALYNASGPRPADRDDGRQPRDRRADQHLERPHATRCRSATRGWIQLYAESNQEALDLHIQAFRLAEELSLPVMVCMDGFILTHAFERVDVPTQEQVDAFLPPFEPRQVLDPDEPVTIGAMVGPEAFTEVSTSMHAKQMQALDADPARSPPSSRARSAATPAGSCAATAPRTPRRSSSRSARCSARSRTSSTSCATRA